MHDAVFDTAQGTVTCGDVDLCSLDGLVIKKVGKVYMPSMLDRLELLDFVHRSGCRVFSKPSHVLRLIDRLSCTVALRLADIPMPPTVVTEDVDRAVEAARRFERSVLKPLYSTKARGMRILDARNGEDLADEVRSFQSDGNPVLYLQAMVDIPGRDLGIAFLGGEYLGSYARVGSGEAWNTTVHAGGRYAAEDPSPELIDLARRAQAPFGLDFTVVDVAETSTGPIVFEVSAFGGFRGLREGAGIDAADRYAEYVLQRLSDVR